MDSLLTEQPNPASEGIDALPTEQILSIINNEDRKVAEAVAAVVPDIARAVEAVVERIRNGGRLFYVGAGTSGRLGVLDASECPPTFQVSPDMVQGIIAGGPPALVRSSEAAEDDPDIGARDVKDRGFTGKDVLLGIATSGRTPYVLGAIRQARAMGAVTIGLSSNPDSELSQCVDVAITPLTGAEIIAGSTRMKAGTATKMVLNMISTAVMIRLGHVYGNLMVNVLPVNSKLEDRARRIVAEAGRVVYDEAAALLDASGGVPKVAIVMARLGVSRQNAEERLERAGGSLSAALNTETNGQVSD